MQEITLKDVLEQYHMKLEGMLLQGLWQIDFQKLFHLGQKFFWTGNTEPPCGTILRTGKAYTPYCTNDWRGSLLRGHFHPTVGKAGYIIINNGAAKFEWSALNKSRRKPIWNLVLSVVCRQMTTAPEAGIFGQSEREKALLWNRGILQCFSCFRGQVSAWCFGFCFRNLLLSQWSRGLEYSRQSTASLSPPIWRNFECVRLWNYYGKQMTRSRILLPRQATKPRESFQAFFSLSSKCHPENTEKSRV